MIKIRKAEVRDTSQLEALFLITRQDTFFWEKPNKFKIEDFKRMTLGETVFVAENENATIVGFISIWEKDRPVFIHHLFIDPNHQRQGIGELLIQSLLIWLPTPYRLKCLVKNENALDFYHKHGWVKVGQGVSEEGEYLLLELPSDGNN